MVAADFFTVATFTSLTCAHNVHIIVVDSELSVADGDGARYINQSAETKLRP